MPEIYRRICWPKPDIVCLQGGCLYCNDHPFRALSTIERVVQGGELVHALRYGLRRGNVETKIR